MLQSTRSIPYQIFNAAIGWLPKQPSIVEQEEKDYSFFTKFSPWEVDTIVFLGIGTQLFMMNKS